jgi:proteasome beta subunit
VLQFASKYRGSSFMELLEVDYNHLRPDPSRLVEILQPSSVPHGTTVLAVKYAEARLMRVELEHYEKIEGESLELDGKANKLAQMVRSNLPAAMQGLVVVPLFAGYDLRRRTGRLWKFDVTGGRYEEAEFDATGSGGLYARESLKKVHRNDASREAGLRMTVMALVDAADEDRATGGVDLVRGIFPLVRFCTADGISAAEDSEIEHVYREIIEGRGRGAS